MTVYATIYMLKRINYQLSDDRQHLVDCVQKVFQLSFDRVHHLDYFCIKYNTVGLIRLTLTYKNKLFYVHFFILLS